MIKQGLEHVTVFGLFLAAFSNFPAPGLTHSKLGEACHLRFRRGTNHPETVHTTVKSKI